MKLRMLTDKQILFVPNIWLKKDEAYEVQDVVFDCYQIKVPMKQKGKFRYALVKEDEGLLID